MQKAIESGVVVLTADPGMMLTNGGTFCTVARLGANAHESGWWEITTEEAERQRAELEADEDLSDSEALAIIMGGRA